MPKTLDDILAARRGGSQDCALQSARITLLETEIDRLRKALEDICDITDRLDPVHRHADAALAKPGVYP